MRQTPVNRLAGERKSSEACGIQPTADYALPKPISREESKSGRRKGQYSTRSDGDYRRSSNMNTQAAMQHTAVVQQKAVSLRAVPMADGGGDESTLMRSVWATSMSLRLKMTQR